MSLPVVFSGIQPSGVIHLGNYLGAINNWLPLQSSNSCFFCIVDLHAITNQLYEPGELEQNTINVVASYISCGIDPQKSVIFCQSHIHGHAELSWILNCITPMGWLNRMTQFKDKSSNDKSTASLGLYAYPILMAADILLYDTTYVPVGDDQKQHLELVREIANTFNHRYKTGHFKIPEPLIFDNVSRIMSLRDGKKKMSKSEESDYSRINLNDDDDLIIKKIKKATTDSIIGFEINSLLERKEICNLIGIYSALSNQKVSDTCNEMQGKGMNNFKNKLSDILISTISPIRSEMNKLLKDISYIKNIIKIGNEKAEEISNRNILKVKELVGFMIA